MLTYMVLHRLSNVGQAFNLVLTLYLERQPLYNWYSLVIAKRSSVITQGFNFNTWNNHQTSKFKNQKCKFNNLRNWLNLTSINIDKLSKYLGYVAVQSRRAVGRGWLQWCALVLIYSCGGFGDWSMRRVSRRGFSFFGVWGFIFGRIVIIGRLVCFQFYKVQIFRYFFTWAQTVL